MFILYAYGVKKNLATITFSFRKTLTICANIMMKPSHFPLNIEGCSLKIPLYAEET